MADYFHEDEDLYTKFSKITTLFCFKHRTFI